MKTVSTTVLGLLLSMCLALYGTSGMARSGGGAVFSMEICADGVAKTVMLDASGTPIEPAENCPECLTCCQAIWSLMPENCVVSPSFVPLEIKVGGLIGQDPRVTKRNIYPAPRGPPAVQPHNIHMPWPILLDRFAFGHMTRSDGRPMLKDATA